MAVDRENVSLSQDTATATFRGRRPSDGGAAHRTSTSLTTDAGARLSPKRQSTSPKKWDPKTRTAVAPFKGPDAGSRA